MKLGYKYRKKDTFKKYLFKVSDIHEIYVEERGNPEGIPVICFHGGPGGGINEAFSQFFNPKFYHVILFDQRGCGKSKPFLETKDNNIFASISDAEKLRKSLSIKAWHVFGGSYGSTLSLSYAIEHPEHVLSLVIRGVFLGKTEEINWLYQYGASEVFPEAHGKLLEIVPKEKQNDILSFYYNEIFSNDKMRKLIAATHWINYEISVSHIVPETHFNSLLDESEIAMAVIETHYFYNKIFSDEDFILKNTEKLKDIPVYIVHGRYDMCCHPSSAYRLKQAMPWAKLFLVNNAGHSQFDTENFKMLKKIMDDICQNFKKKKNKK